MEPSPPAQERTWRRGVRITTPNDHALVEQARSGDREAFAELVRRHREGLYAFAARLTRDADRALDITQEALLRAFANLGRYRGESAFRTWLFAIALNVVRSAARRRSRDEVDLDHAGPLVDTNPGPDRSAGDAEEVERVARVLARLPPKQRAAVVLRVYEELSFREIGEVLGCAEGAARVNYHHGIKKLREMMS